MAVSDFLDIFCRNHFLEGTSFFDGGREGERGTSFLRREDAPWWEGMGFDGREGELKKNHGMEGAPPCSHPLRRTGPPLIRVKRNKTAWFQEIFSFSNFSKIRKFRNRTWYQLKQIFLINYQYFLCYATFCWNFDTLLNRFDACSYIVVTPGILLHMHL